MTNERTKEDQVLILETLIKERSMIIYVIESDLIDNKRLYSRNYKDALKDEIANHKIALKEYKKGLTKIKKT